MEDLQTSRRLILGGTAILAALAVLSTVVLSWFQYDTKVDEYRQYLSGRVEAHGLLLDVLSTFTTDPSLPELESRRRVLQELTRRYPREAPLGETGVFVLGFREGDRIILLQEDYAGHVVPPTSVPWAQEMAQPMRLALTGNRGTAIAKDFRGEHVVAAYQPIPGLGLGLVGKIDLAELRRECLLPAILTALLTALLVVSGGVVLLRFQVRLMRLVERKEAHHRDLLESAGDAMMGVDGDGRVIWSNTASARIFGCEVAELVGSRIDGLLIEFGGGRLELTDYTRAAAGDHLTAIGRRVNGEEFRAEVSVAKVQSQEETSGLGEFVVVIRDLTEQRKAELLLARQSAELEIARRRAEQANLAKSEFLANMSHEIRTPMTAILGFADVLSEVGISAQERSSAVATIRRNGVHLLNLINDILDLSKIESGRVEAECLQVDPCEVIAEVVSLMEVRFAHKDVPLIVEYSGEIPEVISTDPTRVRQILINLLGNAIKFTDVGRVELVVSLTPDTRQNGNHELVFDVVDTGLGMTPEQIEYIFEPFAQADNSTTRVFGGTGLGLVISQRFARMLGGDVTVVSSELGVGTRFRLTIAVGTLEGVKLRQPTGVAPRPPSDSDYVRKTQDGPVLEGYQILLAEDGPDNQRLISRILAKLGASVNICDNGERAYRETLTAESIGKPFHVVLMDVQMPVLDGLAATEKLRAAGYQRPIIALTAHAMAGDRDRCLAAGCDEYTTKPVRKQELIDHIRRVAPLASTGPRPSSQDCVPTDELETA